MLTQHGRMITWDRNDLQTAGKQVIPAQATADGAPIIPVIRSVCGVRSKKYTSAVQRLRMVGARHFAIKYVPHDGRWQVSRSDLGRYLRHFAEYPVYALPEQPLGYEPRAQ